MREYQVIVIGAGVAGLSAAMASAAHGLSTLVIDRQGVGGQVVNIEHIENFPGFPDGISGIELGPALQEQAETVGADFLLEEVTGLKRDGDLWQVACADKTFAAPAVIVATGSALRKLDVPGEKEFVGRGVSNCASCDGPLFRGEDVLVAGGGDSAIQEALALGPHVNQVIVVHDGAEPTAQPSLMAKLDGVSNISLRSKTRIRELRGDKTMTSAVLDTGEGTEEIAVGGVFPFIGLSPNNGLLDGIADRDESGRLVVDGQLRLSSPGLWAAGDVRSGSICWLAAAAGDGVTAAVCAARSLKVG